MVIVQYSGAIQEASNTCVVSHWFRFDSLEVNCFISHFVFSPSFLRINIY